MNIEIIDKWLDEEYGVSYTELEELHNYLLDKCEKVEQENIELKKEFKKLKSEIFWLKQENIDKNECIEAYLSMLDERDNRIDKAIEYIEYYTVIVLAKQKNESFFTYDIDTEGKEKLLDILKGSEDNDK